jgi:hypothetical protein
MSEVSAFLLQREGFVGPAADSRAAAKFRLMVHLEIIFHLPPNPLNMKVSRILDPTWIDILVHVLACG